MGDKFNIKCIYLDIKLRILPQTSIHEGGSTLGRGSGAVLTFAVWGQRGDQSCKSGLGPEPVTDLRKNHITDVQTGIRVLSNAHVAYTEHTQYMYLGRGTLGRSDLWMGQ